MYAHLTGSAGILFVGSIGRITVHLVRSARFRENACTPIGHWIWQAKEAGIPFRMPPAHPFPPLPPLRLAIALQCDRAAIETTFDHIWRDGIDIGDPQGWKSLADKLGVADADALIDGQEVKDQLRINTESAIEQGIFGVPTTSIDDEQFWGYDSTSMLLAYLEDPAMLQDSEMVRVLDLPRGNIKRD